MSQPYMSTPLTSARKMADKCDLVSFDVTWHRGAYYVSVPNYQGGTVYTSAYVVSLRAQLASARKALDGAAEYLQKHAARRTIMLSQTSWRPKRSTVEADRNAMVSVENTLRAALKDLPK